MAVTLKENVYGLTGTGKRVRIGHVTETEIDLFPVGGKIFYIDPLSDEEVEFFDQYGDPIASVSVGDTPYAYRVVNQGTSGRDKYYVFYDQLYSNKRWTYYENGAYVYNSLGTARGIGKGKTNTEIVMNADSGKYVTNDSNGYPTIWYQIKLMRDGLFGGCDDWFVPSDAEIEELRKAIGYQKLPSTDPVPTMTAGAVTGGNIAGTADGQEHSKEYNGYKTYYPSSTKFINSYIWASSEYSASAAWNWGCNDQSFNPSNKSYNLSVFGVRAF